MRHHRARGQRSDRAMPILQPGVALRRDLRHLLDLEHRLGADAGEGAAAEEHVLASAAAHDRTRLLVERGQHLPHRAGHRPQALEIGCGERGIGLPGHRRRQPLGGEQHVGERLQHHPPRLANMGQREGEAAEPMHRHVLGQADRDGWDAPRARALQRAQHLGGGAGARDSDEDGPLPQPHIRQEPDLRAGHGARRRAAEGPHELRRALADVVGGAASGEDERATGFGGEGRHPGLPKELGRLRQRGCLPEDIGVGLGIRLTHPAHSSAGTAALSKSGRGSPCGYRHPQSITIERI